MNSARCLALSPVLARAVFLCLAAVLAVGCGQRAATANGAPVPASADVDREVGAAVERLGAAPSPPATPIPAERLRRGAHRIGPEDLLEITVFEAPELTRSVRVSSEGQISLPLLGQIDAAGLSPQELQTAVEDRLRGRYMHDPQVSVTVSEIQSQPVSVLGAVTRPGIFQVRGPQTLIEVLALAGGLSEDAGETALVVRGGSDELVDSDAAARAAEQAEEVSLGILLETGDGRYNVPVYPGDVVKVPRAGMVYVVGEVRQPGVFPLSSRTGMSLMQAVALSEGPLPTAAQGRALIIRTTPAGERTQLEVDLRKVLAGKAPDPTLQPRDIVFIPNSTGKSVALGVIETLARMVTLRAVF